MNLEFTIRRLKPEEFAVFDRLMVEVYSAMDGFPVYGFRLSLALHER